MKKIVLFVCIVLQVGQLYAADLSMKKNNLDLVTLPKKVLIIEPEIYVKELSVGGVAERVEDWSNTAKNNVIAVIDAQISQKRIFDKAVLPKDLEVEAVNLLEEHVALYDLVGFNAFYYGRGQVGGWDHKKGEFDYTLGAGLKEISEKTGADAAMFVVGEDYISSGGRKAARIFAALMGVVLPASPTFLSVGLIDLKSGDLLWMNYGTALDSKDLRKPEDVKKMLDEMLQYYPGRVSSVSKVTDQTGEVAKKDADTDIKTEAN
jgi:hypothetical protein